MNLADDDLDALLRFAEANIQRVSTPPAALPQETAEQPNGHEKTEGQIASSDAAAEPSPEANGHAVEPPPVTGESDFGLPDETTAERVEETLQKSSAELEWMDATEWQDKPIPVLKWLARNRIPAGDVTILGGDGATGKTLIAEQLAVAVLRGTDWLGAVIEQSGPVMFFSAEESAEELHRRGDDIVRHNHVRFEDLKGLHIHCRPGKDSVLGHAGRDGIVRGTALYESLFASARRIRPALIVVESAADVFAGNENDRSQARQFIGLLRRIALETGAAVLLIAHPSLSGLASGTGTSGSTGWNNSARSRLYFTKLKAAGAGDDDTESAPNIRHLKTMKANYGPPGEVVAVRWERGVFVLESTAPSVERLAAEAQVDETFLRCLEVATARGLVASPHGGRNYAPTVFASMVESGGIKPNALAASMRRLEQAGKIIRTTTGNGSHKRTVLERKPVADA